MKKFSFFSPNNLGKVYYCFSILALFLIWKLASFFPDTDIPPPSSVLSFAIEEIQNGQLFFHIGATLFRVVLSFFIAFVLGLIWGLSMGFFKNFNSFSDFWLIFFLNIPALVVILLSYIMLGLTEFAAVTAVVLNKTPNQAVLFREAARSFEKQYLALAQIYRISHFKIFTEIILPQIFPFIISAARSGLSLIWKIVLVVELLGRSNGVGFQLHSFFQLFYIEGILAYSISFIFIVQMIEWLILMPLEKRANKWRQ